VDVNSSVETKLVRTEKGRQPHTYFYIVLHCNGSAIAVSVIVALIGARSYCGTDLDTSTSRRDDVQRPDTQKGSRRDEKLHRV
jgi:hypothetical protein